MELVLYKRPIEISVNTLTTLMNNFKVYTEPINYSEDEKIQMDEAQTAIDLISGGIKQIKRASEDIRALINQHREYYSNATTKDERRNLLEIIKETEETGFNTVLGKAN